MNENMIPVYVIRHGMTYGNSLSRYIGVTDEPLMEGEADRLLALAERYRQAGLIPEKANALWVSPLTRCRQTAAVFYPDAVQHCTEDLRECHFGKFENKNYRELDGDPDYQAWIDSNATLPFPGGESVEGFTARTVNGFRQAAGEALQAGMTEILLFVHGGSIMSLLSACSESDRQYYEWHVQNAEGYRAMLDVQAFLDGEQICLHDPVKIAEQADG